MGISKYINVLLISALVLFASPNLSHSDPSIGDSQRKETPGVADSRQLVSIPIEARSLMREEMLSHLSALNAIIGHLASNNLEAAADTAESRLGISSTGKHRPTGTGPGRVMPLPMRNIGWSMHESATELSQAAKDGNLEGAYDALQKITSACVACHYSYRTQ